MGVSVQGEDFDLGQEIAALTTGRTDLGAVASFIGTVRDVPLNLEHYPGMTERALQDIYEAAIRRFDLRAARLIHRYGPLQPGDQIVLVIACSAHRAAALQAIEFIMDRLKTDAPFWKLEGDQWVDARESDTRARNRWD